MAFNPPISRVSPTLKNMSKNKQLKRRLLQQERLRLFEGDYYQEKKVGDMWYIKMWNGSSKQWQVAVFSDISYRKYKSFDRAKEEVDEMDKRVEQIAWERPTLESIKKITDGNQRLIK